MLLPLEITYDAPTESGGGSGKEGKSKLTINNNDNKMLGLPRTHY